MGALKFAIWTAATGALFIPSAIQAQETATYTYDALGRLIATSTSGGPNSGIAMSTAFDPAGNRTNYTVSTAPPAPHSIGNTTETTVTTDSDYAAGPVPCDVVAGDEPPDTQVATDLTGDGPAQLCASNQAANVEDL